MSLTYLTAKVEAFLWFVWLFSKLLLSVGDMVSSLIRAAVLKKILPSYQREAKDFHIFFLKELINSLIISRIWLEGNPASTLSSAGNTSHLLLQR